ELLALTWENVNLERKTLTVVASTAKSGRTRHIPLNTEALDVLKRWRKYHKGSGYVFASNEGERMATVTTSWRKVVAAAKLVDFRFHDLRHTFASHLVMQGIDLYTVKKLLGHSDFAMTEKYAHLAPDHLAAAVAVLGNRSAVPQARRG
ncbi:MAG: tyrosine-type recombinase/integrase, partial [Gammaproteobacteria bacterium]